MNLTEVINRLRYKAANIKAKLEPEYFSECADYLERYRWHDLRENPDDIPERNKRVEVCEELGMDRGWIYATGYWLKEGVFCVCTWRSTKVIAWRYIEPFEEYEPL